MPYPEKLLADDEQVVKHLHPSWITIAPGFIAFVVLCAAAGVGIAFAPDKGTSHNVVLIIIAVVWFILVCWLFIRPLITWRTSHYVFTTHRVLIRRGLLKQTGRDIALQRISDVGFEQTLWDRMVRAGTLTIESASEHGQEMLKNVPNSSEQQQLLNRLIEQDGERRARNAYGGGQNLPPQGQQGYPQQGNQQGNQQQGGGYQPTQPQPPYQQG
ncbi:MAG TPA: PH domain-containing protein [Jatrophihabitantaceae bacterium]